MKLFIREHILLLFVQTGQFGLFILICWLAGFRDVGLLLYAAFIGYFLLLVYLSYRYISRRRFYQRLEQPLEQLGDVFTNEEQAPISLALAQLLTSNYQLHQQELQQLKKEQEQQLVFMDLWVHQMKTPLSVIDLIARDLDEPYSTSIRDEGERIQTGLNTVLHMSRLRGLRNDFHVTQTKLIDIIQRVHQEHKRFYIRNQIYPKIVVEDKDVFVETDVKWLYFILTQIIHNAVKYSVGRSKQIIIRIGMRNETQILEVMDEGIGIPVTDIRRIFDAFYTGENGRIYKESTGVGLYVVKEVATYLGHTLEVESTVDVGTTVRIIF